GPCVFRLLQDLSVVQADRRPSQYTSALPVSVRLAWIQNPVRNFLSGNPGRAYRTVTIDSRSDVLSCIPSTGMQDRESPLPSYADESERNLAVPFQRGGDSLAD